MGSVSRRRRMSGKRGLGVMRQPARIERSLGPATVSDAIEKQYSATKLNTSGWQELKRKHGIATSGTFSSYCYQGIL